MTKLRFPDKMRRTRWRRNGKELLFVSSGKIMSAELTVNGSMIQVGSVQPLFGGLGRVGAESDVTADVQRFLIPLSDGETGADAATLVQNWPAAVNSK
jgi:hypothetical protein